LDSRHSVVSDAPDLKKDRGYASSPAHLEEELNGGAKSRRDSQRENNDDNATGRLFFVR